VFFLDFHIMKMGYIIYFTVRGDRQLVLA
jgi:hypothetical protein